MKMKIIARLYVTLTTALAVFVVHSALLMAVTPRPVGLAPGSQYQVLLVTQGVRNAASSNIADYNAFVNAEVALNPLLPSGVTWSAVAFTDTITAQVNAPSNGLAIFDTKGNLLVEAGIGLYAAVFPSASILDQFGSEGSTYVWTGAPAPGYSDPNRGYLGDIDGVNTGFSYLSGTYGSGWINHSARLNRLDLLPLYALSSPITVPEAEDSDMDGDGKADLTVFRPSSGVWYTIPSKSSNYTSTQWGVQSDVPVLGDYDGDGKSDVAVWRPSAGVWYILPSGTIGTYTATAWGLPSDIPVPGDYDGDYKDDIAVWRPSTGVWYVLPSGSPGTYTATQWGVNTDIPVPGDYDGDGKADIAVWRPSSGIWYVLTSSVPGSYTSTQWGMSTDNPTPGDYDRDGKTDIAVWRPSTGVWYVLPSGSPGTYTATQWGVNTDIPVPGDYDGDGKADIAVFRPSNGIWYILPSTAPGTYGAIQWGISTDVPLSSITGILGRTANLLVPNVVGLSQAAATTAITNAGLVLGTVSTANSNSVSTGNVISQSPVSGSSVAPNSAVNLTVSLGPTPFAGIWNGTTMQGQFFSLTVSGDGVTNLQTYVQVFPPYPCSPLLQSLTPTYSPALQIVSGSFTGTGITGSFTTSTTASGTLSVQVMTSCGPAPKVDTTWTATK
jgi:hypothetical protein